MNQTSSHSSLFSSSLPPAPDRPLTPSGRFNRLSYLAWYGFINLMGLMCLFGTGLIMGIFSLSQVTWDDQLLNALSGSFGFIMFGISILFFYFHVVLIIRRLHDTNRSGWWCLLFFVPVIQFILIVYLLLVPGSKANNDYGAPRPSPVWEKILGWMILIVLLLSLLMLGRLFSFMMGTGHLDLPHKLIPKNTGYF